MQSARGFVCLKLICISVKCQRKVRQIEPAIVTIYVEPLLCTLMQKFSNEEIKGCLPTPSEPIDCLG